MTIAKRVLLLTLLAASATALVAVVHHFTQERIAYNQEAWRMAQLNQLIESIEYDNDLLLDTIELNDPEFLGPTTVTAYRARQAGEPVAIIFTAITPKGYNGAITLLVGVTVAGDTTGVRVVSHQETPGLGDRIEVSKSDWIRQFDGRTLEQPSTARWKVKKDGGDFDQLTGATITSRGITDAVHNVLLYFEANQDVLW